MIRVHTIIWTLQDLTFGMEHPTHIFVGLDLWEFFHELCDRLRNIDGSIPFQGCKVILDGNIPGYAAHFQNVRNPHHPSYNRYCDWTDAAREIGPEL